MGSAISLFENSKTILVPSKRFIPVKNTNNLLFLLSDLVSMNEDFELNPIKQIYIELNPKYYKNVDDFYRHFKEIPNLLDCKSLKVTNEKFFNKSENLTGNIEL
jgi:UTP--glucose-1-phosphate uridylyltransferase